MVPQSRLGSSQVACGGGTSALRFAIAVAGSIALAGAVDRRADHLHRLPRVHLRDGAISVGARLDASSRPTDGLVAAWFGGTAEKNPDVGIWVSRQSKGHGRRRWKSQTACRRTDAGSPPGTRCCLPCPNGPLALFYKVGPSPSEWWGMVSGVGRLAARGVQPRDLTWREPRRLPDGILGPIRAKPVLLDSNTLLAGSSTEDAGWRAHMELFRATSDERRTTNSRTPNDRASEWLAARDDGSGVDEDAAAEHSEGVRCDSTDDPRAFAVRRLQILCRTEQGVIAESWSNDGGATWSAMKATRLPNPSAGIDVVKLSNGLFVLAYNPSAENRHVIALSTSMDGVTWSAPMTIEEGPGEYSYPAIIQTRDGLVHMTYTWRRQSESGTSS